ncbi:hypothetical protein V1511DRAFT_492533 [Dipodascopsis uninucleata]
MDNRAKSRSILQILKAPAPTPPDSSSNNATSNSTAEKYATNRAPSDYVNGPLNTGNNDYEGKNRSHEGAETLFQMLKGTPVNVAQPMPQPVQQQPQMPSFAEYDPMSMIPPQNFQMASYSQAFVPSHMMVPPPQAMIPMMLPPQQYPPMQQQPPSFIDPAPHQISKDEQFLRSLQKLRIQSPHEPHPVVNSEVQGGLRSLSDQRNTVFEDSREVDRDVSPSSSIFMTKTEVQQQQKADKAPAFTKDRDKRKSGSSKTSRISKAINISAPADTMSAQSKYELNKSVLSRYDPYIHKIMFTSAHAVLYKFVAGTNAWEKLHCQGTMFIYSKTSAPVAGSYDSNMLGDTSNPHEHVLVIMNRHSIRNFILRLEDITDIERLDEFIMVRSPYGAVNGWSVDLDDPPADDPDDNPADVWGLWIYTSSDRPKIERICRKYMNMVTSAKENSYDDEARVTTPTRSSKSKTFSVQKSQQQRSHQDHSAHSDKFNGINNHQTSSGANLLDVLFRRAVDRYVNGTALDTGRDY